MKKFRFHKSERLKSRKEISSVFTDGSVIFRYPIKMHFLFRNSEENLNEKPKIAISIPKKRIRRAHKRNTLKRRVREAYRLNSQTFKHAAAVKKLQINIVFVYIATEMEDYRTIERAVISCLDEFKQRYL